MLFLRHQAMNNEMYISIKHHSTSVLIFKEQYFWTFSITNGKVQKKGEDTGMELRRDTRIKVRLQGTTSSTMF